MRTSFEEISFIETDYSNHLKMKYTGSEIVRSNVTMKYYDNEGDLIQAKSETLEIMIIMQTQHLLLK